MAKRAAKPKPPAKVEAEFDAKIIRLRDDKTRDIALSAFRGLLMCGMTRPAPRRALVHGAVYRQAHTNEGAEPEQPNPNLTVVFAGQTPPRGCSCPSRTL